jgi:hypothetical protein
VHMHTTASWPAREDRRVALVWLAIFWIFVGVGFGFDLHNYLHEQPPVPCHRRFGWFAAGYAALIVVIAPWSELSWQALNLQTPGALPPQFLSIAFSGVFCMAVLLPWGILMRRNSSRSASVKVRSERRRTAGTIPPCCDNKK